MGSIYNFLPFTGELSENIRQVKELLAKKMDINCTIPQPDLTTSIDTKVNEALIDLDNSRASKATIDNLNQSFFMVFQVEWKSLDFVAPETLNASQYSASLASMLRYSRNMMQHTERHKNELAKHYGSPAEKVTSIFVLKQMRKSTRNGVMHFYWFGQRHLQLDFGIPENCLRAYEDWMALERDKIAGGVKALFEKVCHNEAPTPKDAGVNLEETYHQSCKDIRQLMEKSDREFKVIDFMILCLGLISYLSY